MAVNGVAGQAEASAGQPLINRARGVFSACVVAGLGTGVTSSAGQPPAVRFVAAAALCLVASAVTFKALPTGSATHSAARASATPRNSRPQLVPLLLMGIVGALALAKENAHQSWSALSVFGHGKHSAHPRPDA